ncbi:MAG: NAD(P)H-hydrate dehydratase [Bacteroidetes bacterium]|nr:NAD(P)H-hydrate dehydratase [Bacteroidota bacterium]
MLKVLNQDQVRWMDQETIKREPISSIDLMERASRVFSGWFQKIYPNSQPVYVLAGTGNNGGDGLAVARHLIQAGYPVSVGIVWFQAPGSDDFRLNLERLERLHPPLVHMHQPDDWRAIEPGTIVVDALFGSGLNRPLQGLAEAVVQRLNSSGAEVVSIDLPSGLFADAHTKGTAVRASRCLSFAAPKKALLLPDSQAFCQAWDWLPIGWFPGLSDTLPAGDFWVETADLAASFPQRQRFGHKNLYGHVLVAGGRTGMRGAAWLAAEAALRAGAGLASCWLTNPGADHCPRTPEIMHPSDPSGLLSSAVVAAGPGMGKDHDAKKQLVLILTTSALPPILDADALNLLAAQPDLLKKLPPGSILTPHPGEFQRLFGATAHGFDRLERLRAAAVQLRSTIVLKGAHSVTATPEGHCYFNSSGNPGMATAGSGDVLTGVIAALRAQGLPAEKAAIAGVCWHGLAGDRAALARGQAGLLASDLIRELPVVRNLLRATSPNPQLG